MGRQKGQQGRCPPLVLSSLLSTPASLTVFGEEKNGQRPKLILYTHSFFGVFRQRKVLIRHSNCMYRVYRVDERTRMLGRSSGSQWRAHTQIYLRTYTTSRRKFYLMPFFDMTQISN